MALRVAAWNVDTGANAGEADANLQYPRRMEAAKKAIGTLGAEVVVLSDTSQWSRIFGNRGLAEAMRPHGYDHAVCIDLEDQSLRVDTGVAILSKLALRKTDIVRMADRNGLVVQVADPESEEEVQVAAAYLHHDNVAKRKSQATALRERLDPSLPTIIAGDLNDGHHHSREVRRLGGGATRFAFRHLSALTRLEGSRHPKVRQVGAVLSAIKGMEEGQVMAYLGRQGFRDADVGHRPTAPTTFPFLQPDHIMHDARWKVVDFQVHRDVAFKAVSDHYPISATLEVV